MNFHLPALNANDVETIFSKVRFPVMAFLPEGLLAWANESAVMMFGPDASLLIGSRLDDLPLRGPRNEGTLVDGARYEWVRASGQSFNETFVANVVKAGSSERPLTLVLLIPAEAPKADVISLGDVLGGRHASRPTAGRIDPNSGLLDRASISGTLEAEVSRSRRYANPLSIVFVGIAVGASWPVASGYDPVQEVSQLLKEETRWADDIGRWDADLLLMVLAETDFAAAGSLVSKLGRRLDNMVVRFGQAQWQRGDDATLLCRRALDDLSIAVHPRVGSG
ncbi:MAG: GGDEF domain-containing protein [Gammaproteobacteria bacterium]|jgi:GGDEF domain-containing protein